MGPKVDEPPYPLDDYWRGLSHPTWDSHQLVADVLAYNFKQVFSFLSVFDRKLKLPERTGSLACKELKTVFNRQYFPASKNDKEWKFYCDRPPDKCGWIAESEEEGGKFDLEINVQK